MRSILEDKPVLLDLNGAVANIRRQGTPERVFHFEHGFEEATKQALCARFHLCEDLRPGDGHFQLHRDIRIHQFLGIEWLRTFPRGIVWAGLPTDTTAAPPAVGPIRSWQDFQQYPWPMAEQVDFSDVEWLERNLPENMAFWAMSYLFQQVSNLIGFTPLCMMLYENRDLVRAVAEKVGSLYVQIQEVMCQFDRCGAINIGDDMGHKSATLIAPQDLHDLFVPWQQRIAEVAHRHGKLCVFHTCGQVAAIMDDLIDTVQIDAKHSTQDCVEPITVSKQRWGARTALLGGMDVDFITRAEPVQVRSYTRNILEACMPGGGFALGVGNWVADSIPLDNYLAMHEEARRFG
jgi:uroporphyrinogen decarboxylase